MKVLAALVSLALAAAIGANQPQAAEKTAKLSDPATSGEQVYALPGAVEKASLPGSAARTGLSGLERDRIRSSIRKHITALTQNNSNAAYETLTPIIKDYYSNPNAFLDIMKNELQPVAKAKSFAFMEIQREATDAIQSVLITGPDDREWIAQYRLQRQGDGRWAIMGCQVDPAVGQQT